MTHFSVCAIYLPLYSKKGFDVRSYGTGSVVKLPGPGPEQPNVYDFGTTYQFMSEDLYRKDPHLYLPPSYFKFLAISSCSWGQELEAVARSTLIKLKIFLLFFVRFIVVQWKCNVILADIDAPVGRPLTISSKRAASTTWW